MSLWTIDECKVMLAAKNEFDSSKRTRLMHGCNADDVNDPRYVSCLDKYVRVCVKNFKDCLSHGAPPSSSPTSKVGSTASNAIAVPADVRDYCKQRFAFDSTIRKLFKVYTDFAEDPAYEVGLERYIKAEAKNRRDNDPDTRKAAFATSENDAVSRVLNKPELFSGRHP